MRSRCKKNCLIRQKIKLRSKLDLLFARYNLAIKNSENAIEKLTNSIILASRIYSPESPELTSYYYYLARYFISNKEKDIVIVNIFYKVNIILIIDSGYMENVLYKQSKHY